ncbi:hypothetical protein EDD17DRAFT_1550805 [Pisolithus thermaeus]|nr:hypothetical protein EV401DRAFT_2063538 [Pisolithus croceorrhizus]KAI6166108.1 hypothetical protein EDD17DRAFT_1550805 [Pisolithus thermaeus]
MSFKLWRQTNYNTGSLSAEGNLMSSDGGEEPTLGKANYAPHRSSYNRKLVQFSAPTMEFLSSHRESADSAFQTSPPFSDEQVPLFQLDPYERIGRVESFYSQASWSTDSNTLDGSCLRTPDFSILSTAAMIRSTPITSFQAQFCDSISHAHDVLHARIPDLSAKSCEEDFLPCIHLPILPLNDAPLRESTILPQSPSPVVISPLDDVKDEFSRRQESIRVRRFARNFGYMGLCQPAGRVNSWASTAEISASTPVSSSTQFPHVSGTTHTALDTTPDQDAEIDRNGTRDWRQRTLELAERPDGQQKDYQGDTGSVALRDSSPAREDYTGEIGCAVEANDSDDDDDDYSDCTSIDSTAFGLLFQEVSSMVGMSDTDHSTFCGSSQTGDPVIRDSSVCRNECCLQNPSETPVSARIPGLPRGDRLQLMRLPEPPLTYARLASRPADPRPRAVSNRKPDAPSQRKDRLLRVSSNPSPTHFLERKADIIPLCRQTSADLVGLQPRGPSLADHQTMHHPSRHADNVPTTYASTPLAARNPALDRLDFGLTELKAHAPHQQQRWHSDRGASAVQLKINGTAGGKELPRTASTRPVVQSTVRRPTVTVVPHANNNRRLRRAPGLCPPSRANTLPTTAAGWRTHPYPSSTSTINDLKPVKSFMEMDVPPQRFRETLRGRTRRLMNDGKMGKLVRSARRLKRRIIAWGKNFLTIREVYVPQS